MTITRRLFTASAIAAPFAAALTAPALARAAEPARPGMGMRLQPHVLTLKDGSTLAAEKGTFQVPEVRARAGSRPIPIGFVRLKSTAARPGAPIVYLAGGPGGSATGTFQGARQAVFLKLRETADVILLDQRGTGLSTTIEPWRAGAPFDWMNQTLNEANATAYDRSALEGALAAWRTAGVDITGYTTLESARDIDDLRRHLGVRRLNLMGISYGTHLGLAYMRAFPRRVERAVLSSVEGMDQTVKLPAHIDPVFDRIAAHANRPDLPALIRRVHAKFDAEPQRMTLRAPTGADVAFTTDSFALRGLASALPKNPDGVPNLIRLYEALDAGVYEPIAPILFGQFLMNPATLRGMPEAMDIASGVSPARLAEIDRQAPSSITGRAANYPMPQLRGAIPGLDLGDAFRREVRSEIETLVFSGDLDVRTSLEEQAVATAGLSRKTRVLFRGGGHDLYEAHPAVARILNAWFARGEVSVREVKVG